MAMTEPMRDRAEPQFGVSGVGEVHRERPAAFGVVERDGRIACVFISRPEHQHYDLPGGAVDPGEDVAQALVREFGEETGLVVAPVQRLGVARQYFHMLDGEPVNNLCTLFEARVLGDDPGLKIEDDHTLEWLEPLEAIANLRHDAHAWAVAAWMRRRPVTA
jgi:8-oxo-dGTP diphosphatase